MIQQLFVSRCIRRSVINLDKIDLLDTLHRVVYILKELDSLRFSYTEMFDVLIISVFSIIILDDKDYASDNGDGNDRREC